ncbi:MAG: prolyl oligopeptidase family serine peptidase, partial [Acidimicrobiales bacterium]
VDSPSTSEYRYLDASRPERELRIVIPRTHGVEYSVDHAEWPAAGDQWVVTTNRPRPDGSVATDFAVDRVPIGGGAEPSRSADTPSGAEPGADGDPWADAQEVLPHRPGVKVEGVDAFAGHLVVLERAGGLPRLRVMDLHGGRDYLATPAVATYSMSPGGNPEWTAPAYRYAFSSLATPESAVDLDLVTGAATTVRVQPVRGWDPAPYREERLWAQADDGTEVPISVVGPADRSVPGACLLYGYGAYEIVIDPSFSTLTANLLEAGMSFAIAHIRGGGEMGRKWYEEGRLENKVNTFSDFEASARHLVATGWADPGRIVARGGSAGGLLIGAVANRQPGLWRALVAEVPFVDVLTTMCDPSLPLTIGEWEEWGDPLSDEEAYRRMKAYSPYDNVVAQDYPAIYATGGLNDPRVGYWEPAKWVAKLRALSTGQRRLLLRTELGAGHAGPSGRYEVWRDEARVQAFVLRELGLDVDAAGAGARP